MSRIAHPGEFLSDRRFDLVVKHKFFRHLVCDDDPHAERLYRWHIEKRTGGREGWKQSLDDYVLACRDLLASMQAKGFDPECPVKVGCNGLLMGGAHRIACALVLDCPVHVTQSQREGRAAPWDLKWFEKNGMGIPDRALLVLHAVNLHHEQESRRLHAPRAVHGAPGELGHGVQGRA